MRTNALQVVVLLNLILVAPTFADSHGKFPGKGSIEDFNKAAVSANMALDYSKKGDFETAVRYDREAISIYPYDSGFYQNLGLHLKKLDKPIESRKAFEQSVALEPSYVDSWVGIGYSYEKQRNLIDAERCYRKAVSIQPSWASLCSLGDILRQEGKFEEARKLLSRARACTDSKKNTELVDKCLDLCNQKNEAAD